MAKQQGTRNEQTQSTKGLLALQWGTLNQENWVSRIKNVLHVFSTKLDNRTIHSSHAVINILRVEHAHMRDNRMPASRTW